MNFYVTYFTPNGMIKVEMNDPHRPSRPDELERIEAANGWICVERVINLLQKRIDFNDPEIRSIAGSRLEDISTEYDVSRVIGDISVSRAIGDDALYVFSLLPKNVNHPNWLIR